MNSDFDCTRNQSELARSEWKCQTNRRDGSGSGSGEETESTSSTGTKTETAKKGNPTNPTQIPIDSYPIVRTGRISSLNSNSNSTPTSIPLPPSDGDRVDPIVSSHPDSDPYKKPGDVDNSIDFSSSSSSFSSSSSTSSLHLRKPSSDSVVVFESEQSICKSIPQHSQSAQRQIREESHITQTPDLQFHSLSLSRNGSPTKKMSISIPQPQPKPLRLPDPLSSSPSVSSSHFSLSLSPHSTPLPTVPMSMPTSIPMTISLPSSLSSSSKPNALCCLPLLSSLCLNKRVVVFLDYDGTLTPIVSNPSAALLSDSMRETVSNVAERFPTAIVTGRSIRTIVGFVGLPHLYYAGSHGFDLREPGMKKLKDVATEFIPSLEEFRDSIRIVSKSIPGSEVEDNVYSISVHYRNVEDESKRVELEMALDQLVAQSSGKLVKKLGKMVWEIRPNLNWNKGLAVEYLLKHICRLDKKVSETGTDWQTRAAINKREQETTVDWNHIMPVYCGDDITDEDAFRELNRLCPNSISIFVRSPDRDRPTDANYTLNSTQQVQRFLQFIGRE